MVQPNFRIFRLPAAAAVVLLATSASAHQIDGALGGFGGGFAHPLMGLDHLLAMLAVGIWGAQIGGRARWTMPVAFSSIMAIGGFFGAMGLAFPFVEFGIALSVVALGAVIALKFAPRESLGYLIVGLFALFHGHAHGTEMPVAANAATYGIGFLISTGLIHLVGIAIGTAARKPWHSHFARTCGAALSIAGLYLVVG